VEAESHGIQVSLRERLDRHWFEPAPLRDLAWLRIAIVFVLLADAIWPGTLAQQLQLTRPPAEWFDPIPSLKVLMLPLGWGARPSATIVVIAWSACVVAGIAALVGARTRPWLFVFAMANTFLLSHLFSYGIVQHPQAAAMIVLWMLMLTPSGAALSVDAMRARVAESARRERFVPSEGEGTSRDARWPLRVVQWLLVILYLSAALWKLTRGGAEWLNGYTMQYYLLVDGSAHRVPLAITLAHSHWIGVASAVVTLAFELTFVACVLFPRTTPVYLATGAGLHVGIWLLMQASFFQLLALYAAFAEAIREWRWREAPSTSGRNSPRVWTVVYDGYCPLCIRTTTQLDVLDGASRLRYVDLEREWWRAAELVPGVTRDEMREEMAVVTPEGRVLRGFFAFREIARRVPLLWMLVPVMFAPGAEWAGTRVYAAVAANRARRVCEGSACAVHGPRRAGRGIGKAAVIEFEQSAS
jgi:predicted DCC family thiol-disulfide oxidoreductase YuxK